jgi:hypothetical protein
MTEQTYSPGRYVADITIQFDDPHATDRHPTIDIPKWSRFADVKPFGPTTRQARVEITLGRPVPEAAIRDSIAVQLLRGQPAENLTVVHFQLAAR